MADRCAPQQHAGQYTEQAEIDQQPWRQQFGGLAGIGLQHIAQHRIVDDHAERIHEIRAGCRDHQDQAQHRLEQASQSQQRKQRVVDHHQGDEDDAVHRHCFHGLGRRAAVKRGPEVKVVEDHHEQGAQQCEHGGGPPCTNRHALATLGGAAVTNCLGIEHRRWRSAVGTGRQRSDSASRTLHPEMAPTDCFNDDYLSSAVRIRPLLPPHEMSKVQEKSTLAARRDARAGRYAISGLSRRKRPPPTIGGCPSP